MSFLGVDIGTGSSKAVLVDEAGTLLATAVEPHRTASPRPGWFEHDAETVWWQDFCVLVRRVLAEQDPAGVDAVCVSGIGPVVLVTDARRRPLRPAILYGIDTRAAREIDELGDRLGRQTVLARTGNRLTSQAVGPKLAWLARHEPDTWRQAARWYCASNFLVDRLTGEFVCDHYTASTSDPMYDLPGRGWWEDAWAAVAPGLQRPRLLWPGEVAGAVLPAAAAECGLAPGTPVLAGTVDALAEAYSVGCRDVGDTMVMYGSTLFFIQTVAHPVTHDGLWAATGRTAATWAVAAGMATSGLVATWLGEVTGQDVGSLTSAAAAVPPGSEGLVLLPYFAGERTPLFDPDARGVWLGLTLSHTSAHLYRSALEGVGFGVRHNLEAMQQAGARPRRLVAVGGGTRGSLWTQVVSDITGMPQDLPSITLGASYGDARMAADACGVDTSGWNPAAGRVEPCPDTAAVYDRLYGVYRRAYQALRTDLHLLADLQKGPTR